LSELGVYGYCAVTGFVAAATLSSFYQWVTSQPADFAVARTDWWGVVLAIGLSMFAGPFIVAQKIAAGLRARTLPPVAAFCGVAVSLLWSVCAGIFYTSLLLAA